MAYFYVSSSADLQSALSQAKGGDTIELAGGDYGALNIRSSFTSPLTIVSADNNDPASFSSMSISNSSNITLDSIDFDYTFRSGDTVNVSQRLSDLNKLYPEYDLFVNSTAWTLMGDTPPVEAVHLGDVEVKGRMKSVNTYAVRL